jgi:alanyl-tRNA synthetase
MTTRLYYTDPYLQAFDAIVARVDRTPERLSVILDRTAFYPTSGGQPFDTGQLGDFRVIDVIDEEDGTIAHVLDQGRRTDEGPRTDQGPRPLDQGQTVRGSIDWPRRFDHMQQHTGQHVLSAAIDKLFGVRTVSFHLGAEVSTIDVARELSASEIAAAESEANRIVWEDRPVTIRFADSDEAARLPLRKESLRGGTLRLIDIESFDLSACGGTHVSRTGGIGIIAVANWERFKGGQRIEFVCGGRALQRFRTTRDAVTSSVRLLSVLPDELPAAIQRMQAEAKDQKRAFAGAQEELARFRAEELAASGEAIGAGRVVLRAIDADANGLKALATAVAAKPGSILVLVSVSRPVLIVAARSADVTAVSAQQIVSRLTGQFGGRGGGRPELAQAGGLDADPDAVLAAARDAITAVSGSV